jgi:phosphoglycerol transferase MdoB-like AlkP superfamily enzyme
LPQFTLSRRAWQPTLFLCLAGIVLPNAISLAAMVAGTGVPPRTQQIAAYAALAIAARFVAWPITIALYLAILIYDVLSTIALAFNLGLNGLVFQLHHVADLRLLHSPHYVSLIAAALALAIPNIVLLTAKRARLSQGNLGVLFGLAITFVAFDIAANSSPHYQYGKLYSVGKPMESASLSSGFRQAIIGGEKRPVLLVMVESLGLFANPSHRALLAGPLTSDPFAQRYDVTSGSTTYYGATTAAEMRELCATREPYQSLLQGMSIQCLPGEMARLGYRTIAAHNFFAQFFDRNQWYPRLGFGRSIFLEDLADKPVRQCGLLFQAPCDTEVVPLIAEAFRSAKGPTFVYWLTLSTHVPVAPREGTPRLSCEVDGGALGQTEVCFMTEMWIDVLEALTRMAADLPPMEILIVGDHTPPLWNKAGRNLFVPGQVPWFRFSPKPSPPAQVARSAD